MARINDRLKREGKPPLKKLDDLPKDYQEPDPYLDETVHIAVDLAHLEKEMPAVEPPVSNSNGHNDCARFLPSSSVPSSLIHTKCQQLTRMSVRRDKM